MDTQSSLRQTSGATSSSRESERSSSGSDHSHTGGDKRKKDGSTTTPILSHQQQQYHHPPRRKNKLKAMSGGLMFALGIAWCVSTEYVILRAVNVLPYLYVAQIIPLLIYRGITYYKQHWHHYTLELCYFSNAMLILNIIAFPHSQTFFLINFGLMNGPVLMANVIYRCSMLMDDLQRFISWYMHVAPAVVVFALRWLPHDERFDTCQDNKTCIYNKSPILLLVLALAACSGHALVYNIYVWILSPASTRQHPKYENSYLYLTRRLGGVKTLFCLLNCFGPRGRIFSYTLMNQVFNAMCICLTYAAWGSMTFHLVYLLGVIFITAYYAGTFYVYMIEKAGRAGGENEMNQGVNNSQPTMAGENQVVPILITSGPLPLDEEEEKEGGILSVGEECVTTPLSKGKPPLPPSLGKGGEVGLSLTTTTPHEDVELGGGSAGITRVVTPVGELTSIIEASADGDHHPVPLV